MQEIKQKDNNSLKTFFIIVLKPFQEQKATLCQRVSRPVSKMTEKKREQTHKHFRIYITRDKGNVCVLVRLLSKTMLL